LWTTEPSLVDEVLAELKTLIPSARVEESDVDYEKLGLRQVRFDLQGPDRATSAAIVAILCKLGWEPLSAWEFRKPVPSDGSDTHEPG